MDLTKVSCSQYKSAEPSKLGIAAVAILIVAWFLWFGGNGLLADFTEDDILNLHYYWSQPLGTTVMANLGVPTSYYRPLGAVFYIPLYHAFGLDPLPYRIVCFGLILFNAYLLFQFARHLSSRVDLALIAVFLASYHAWFVDIYYSSGTIYELLCFAGYFIALNRYLSVRQKNELLRKADWMIVAIGYLAALNAKELAVTLPVALAVYEVICHFPARHQLKAWTLTQVLPIAGFAVVTIPYCWVKLSSGLLANHPLYKPQISAGVYLDSFHIYLNPFLYQDHYFRDNNTAQMMGVILILCLALRRRDLLFCCLFTMFSVLPFIFIPHYAGFFWYLPMAGWSVLGAGLIILGKDACSKMLCRAAPKSNINLWKVRNLSTLLVMLPVIILLAVQHTRLSARTLTHFMSAQAPVSALANSLREIRLEASNSEEVQIIVIDDPYRPDFETPALLAQLLLDPLIAGVMRMSGTEFEVMEASGKNKLVLRFDGERFTPVDY